MLDVVGMFREQGSVDELGLGVIRDAFADMLFPGTSTIQTRARYLFFIPWIYLDLERRRTSSARVATTARNRELRLIEALLAGGERRKGVMGVIGERARKDLKRLPSSVYWNSLRLYGIRLYPGSLEQYHRSLDGFYRLQSDAARTDDGDAAEGRLANWHPGLPEAHDAYLEETTFTLTSAEAEYLREGIIAHHPGTLLAFLVDRGKRAKVDFPWEHPQYGAFHPHVREQLEHARNFSEAIHGAQILYNLVLAEARNSAERIQEHGAFLEEWVANVEERLAELQAWDVESFWALADGQRRRIPIRTRRFVESWFDRALDHPDRVRNDEHLRDLVADRERSLKGPRARITNQSAHWGGTSGIDQHSFRWPNAALIIHDILDGLRRPARARRGDHARA